MLCKNLQNANTNQSRHRSTPASKQANKQANEGTKVYDIKAEARRPRNNKAKRQQI